MNTQLDQVPLFCKLDEKFAFNYAPVIGFMLAALWGGWCVDRFGPRKNFLELRFCLWELC
jgi:hypothetical protein